MIAIIIIIVLIALALTLGGLALQFRRDAKKEHEAYIAALNLHNTTAAALEQSEARVKCAADAVFWYAEHLMDVKAECAVLQDRLSGLLCPRNDHVWIDGKCVKCGRTKDD